MMKIMAEGAENRKHKDVELIPCPYCGGKASVKTDINGCSDGWAGNDSYKSYKVKCGGSIKEGEWTRGCNAHTRTEYEIHKESFGNRISGVENPVELVSEYWNTRQIYINHIVSLPKQHYIRDMTLLTPRDKSYYKEFRLEIEVLRGKVNAHFQNNLWLVLEEQILPYSETQEFKMPRRQTTIHPTWFKLRNDYQSWQVKLEEMDGDSIYIFTASSPISHWHSWTKVKDDEWLRSKPLMPFKDTEKQNMLKMLKG